MNVTAPFAAEDGADAGKAIARASVVPIVAGIGIGNISAG
jgi:hypothetical protein